MSPLYRWFLRKRFLVPLAVIVLVGLGWIALRSLTSKRSIARLVRRVVREKLSCEAALDDAEFHLLSGVELRGLRLRFGQEAPWLTIRRLKVGIRTAPLLVGRFEPTDVELLEPVVSLTRQAVEALRAMPSETTEETAFPPRIAIERGKVELAEGVFGRLPALAVEALRLSVANPDRKGRTVEIEGRCKLPPGTLRVRATLLTEARTADIHVAASALRLEDLPRRWLPGALRAHRELAALEGLASVEGRCHFDWSGDKPRFAYSARARLDDVAFPTTHPPGRVTGLSGEVFLRERKVSLREASGWFDGSPIRVDRLDLGFRPDGKLGGVALSTRLVGLPASRVLEPPVPDAVRRAASELGVRSGALDAAIELLKPPDGPTTGILEATVRGLVLRPKAFPYQPPPLYATMSYDLGRGVLRIVQARGNDGRLAVEAAGTVSTATSPAKLAMRARVRGLMLDGALRAAIPTHAAKTWEELGIAGGSLDADITLSGPLNEKLEPNATLELRRVELRPKAFPYSLPPLSGTVVLRTGGEVDIRGLAGERGGLRVRVGGVVSVAGPNTRGDLRFSAWRLPLDDSLMTALPPAVRNAIRRVGLRDGAADATIRLAWGPERTATDADVALRDAVAVPRDFPYRLDNLSARLRYQGARRVVTLDHLAATHGHASLTASGRIVTGAEGKSSLALALKAKGLALDPDLRKALPEKLRKLLDQHGVAGTVDLDGTVHTDASGTPAFAGTLTLHDCSALSKQLPAKVQKVNGTVTVQPDAVAFDHVSAAFAGAALELDGRCRVGKEPALEWLRLSARDLKVDSSLVSGLPQAVRRTIEPLKLSGRLDVALSWRPSAEEPERLRLDATLKGMAATLGKAPDAVRATDLVGALHTDGAHLVTDRLRGKVGEVAFEAQGSLPLKPDVACPGMVVRIPALAVSEESLSTLPPELTAFVKKLKPSGTLEASVTINRQPQTGTAGLASASVRLVDFGLGAARLGRLFGTITLLSHPQKPATIGANFARLRAAGLQLQGLVASGILTPDQLLLDNLSWNLCGGTATGCLNVAFGEKPTYSGNLTIEHLDAESLLSAFIEERNAPSGWLRGKVDFRGDATGLAGFAATGALTINRGSLYDLPLIATVWNVLSLRLPGRGTLTDANVEFEVRDQTLHIRHLLVAGTTTPMDITGTVKLAQGAGPEGQEVDLLFTVAKEQGVLDRLPLVGWLKEQSYNRLRRYLLQARVTGTLGQPKVEVLPHLVRGPIEAFGSFLRKVQPPPGRRP